MGMIADLFVKLGFKGQEFNQGVDSAKAKTSELGSSINKIGGIIAAAFSIGAVINFAKSAVQGYDESALAATRLLTALKGNVGVQQRLIQQAGELQKQTLYEDDVTVAAQAKLTMYTREEAKIKQLIPLIQDFATAQQMDLVSAAGMVGKAVSGSAMALQKMGFEVEGAAGSAERFTSVITVLNDRVGGQAANAARVGAGGIKQLALEYDGLSDVIGGLILQQANVGGGVVSTAKSMTTATSGFLSKVKELGAGGFFQGVAMALLTSNEDYNKILDEKQKKEEENANKLNETIKVTQKAITTQDLYNLTLQELKDNLTEAKQAAESPAIGSSFSTLSKNITDAKKALEEFIKTNAKIPDRGTNVTELTAKSPFKFGTYKSSVPETTVEGGMFIPQEAKTVGLVDTKASIDATNEKIKEVAAGLDPTPIQQFSSDVNSLIASGMADFATSFGEGIGAMMTGDMNIGEFGLTLLGKVGEFLAKLGQMFITYAIAASGFEMALKTPGAWPLALVAGIALVAIGNAISNVSKKGLAGAGGGGSSGGGSASGYSPSSQSSSAMGGNVQFEIQGASLVGVLANNDRKNKNYK